MKTQKIFARDVSGSMTGRLKGRKYKQFKILAQRRRSNVLIDFDDNVYEGFDEFDDKRGGGGTNFEKLFDYVEKHYPFSKLTIFTDGIAISSSEARRLQKVKWIFCKT